MCKTSTLVSVAWQSLGIQFKAGTKQVNCCNFIEVILAPRNSLIRFARFVHTGSMIVNSDLMTGYLYCYITVDSWVMTTVCVVMSQTTLLFLVSGNGVMNWGVVCGNSVRNIKIPDYHRNK